MAIVVSHLHDDFERLAAGARHQAELADLVELRLDRIGHPGREALAGLVRSLPKPVIVTCRDREAYGSFAGSTGELIDLYHDAAEVGARFVDVDWRLSLELGEVQAPCHRIVSRHETEGTPTDLAERHEEVQQVLYEGDVTKVVTHAHRTEDGLRLLAWLRGTKGVIAFCAGEAGRFTRLLAPIFGSPFAYCAPNDPASAPSAPGQWRLGEYLAQLPPGGISQETAVFGVLGAPVGASWSPWVHGMALKAARLDAVYVALEPADLAAFQDHFGDENYRGFSVTAPFKEAARGLAQRCDEAGQRTGAVNTLVREPGGWSAHNTDVGAVRETLERALELAASRADAPGLPARLADARVAVLGTGGAARAAVWAARAVGARVTVLGRRRAAADRLARELDAEAADWDALPSLAHDVLVHATPVGSEASEETRGRAPVPAAWLRPGSVVLDAVYRPIRTPLLAAAHERGCVCVPGGEWFVRQAESQFRLFTGAEPDAALLRKAFEHAHEAHARVERRA